MSIIWKYLDKRSGCFEGAIPAGGGIHGVVRPSLGRTDGG